VVLAIIGRHWLTLTDDNHRLRIDREDDWVRQEIRAAFSDGKRLIPLYVDDAPRIARPDALPGDLRRMLDIQSISLTKDGWERDLLELMNRLQSYGFQLHTVSIPMPERRKRVDALTKEMLYRVPEDFPGWSVVTTYAALGPRETPVPRTELYRELRFASFRAATRFMFEASERIDNGNHHPRWENIWTTVRVWLSTWDIEFQPSSFDLQLAQLIEDEYGKFVAK
jgi:pterin-4a-carbinolamine dehydratase